MAELIISTDKNGFVQVPLTTYKGYQETILQNIPDGEQEVVTKREISDFANSIVSSVNDNFRKFINQQRENMERLANASNSSSNTSDDKSIDEQQENATESAVDTSESVSENKLGYDANKPDENNDNNTQIQENIIEENEDELSLVNISSNEEIENTQEVEQSPYSSVSDIISDSLTTFSSDMMYSFSNLLNDEEETEDKNIVQDTIIEEELEENTPQQVIQNDIIENIDNSVVNVETNNINQVEEKEEVETLDIETSIGNIKSDITSVISDLLSSVELSNTVIVQPLEQSNFEESINYISSGIDEIRDILKSEINTSIEQPNVTQNTEITTEEETVTQQLDNQPEIVEPIQQFIELEEKEVSDKVVSNTDETLPQYETPIYDKILNSTEDDEKEEASNDDYDINSVLDEMVAEDNNIREQLNIFNDNSVENINLRDDSELSKYLRETYDMAPLTDEYEKAVSIMEKLEQNTINENINNNETVINETQLVQETVNNQSSISNNITQVEEKIQSTDKTSQIIDTTELMESFTNSINESTNMIISAINTLKSSEERIEETINSTETNETISHEEYYGGRQTAERIGV